MSRKTRPLGRRVRAAPGRRRGSRFARQRRPVRPRSPPIAPLARRAADRTSPRGAPMNLLRALSTVSGMTLLSRITGLVRESLKATAFGAGLQMDAFEAAFRLPNILRRLFAEGAFSQAFVPIFAEYRRQRGDDETRGARRAASATLLAVALLVVTVDRRAGRAVARLRARLGLRADAGQGRAHRAR